MENTTSNEKTQGASPLPKGDNPLTIPPRSLESEPYLHLDQAIVAMGEPLFRMWMQSRAKESFGGVPMMEFFQHPAIVQLSMFLNDESDEQAALFALRALSWIEVMSIEYQDNPLPETIAAVWLCLKVFGLHRIVSGMDHLVDNEGKAWWTLNVKAIENMVL